MIVNEGWKIPVLSRICTPTGLRSWSGNLQRGWGAFLYKSESPQGFGAVCLLLSRNTLLFVYAFFISSSFQYFNLWLNLHVQREFFVVVFWGVGHRDHLKNIEQSVNPQLSSSEILSYADIFKRKCALTCIPLTLQFGVFVLNVAKQICLFDYVIHFMVLEEKNISNVCHQFKL